MNQPQSGAPAPDQDQTCTERPSHRRGSNVEGHPAAEQQDEERLRNDDETAELEQASESESVDETDILSMGGPDSLEDIEDGDGDEVGH